MNTEVANLEPPEPPAWKTLRIFFADGSEREGIWTGDLWWSNGSQVHPASWQQIDWSLDPV